ncbi:hypothetical protein KC878_03460 [Candidatus Saccharibacteria bacterium]|nr:hypothetical protein [Candidatus Saccharibacteria bacterium]MCB9820968.1 hypothetical protein [Candidatus Nomurabacteria bacterium]
MRRPRPLSYVARKIGMFSDESDSIRVASLAELASNEVTQDGAYVLRRVCNVITGSMLTFASFVAVDVACKRVDVEVKVGNQLFRTLGGYTLEAIYYLPDLGFATLAGLVALEAYEIKRATPDELTTIEGNEPAGE